MPRRDGNTDWSDSADQILRRAPDDSGARQPLRAQARLVALLSSSAPLNALLDGLATYVETWAEHLHCSVLLADPAGHQLHAAAAPSLPVAYVQAVDPVPIGIGYGS